MHTSQLQLPPLPPPPPTVTVNPTGGVTVNMTPGPPLSLSALRARASELSNQLQSAAGRREALAGDLRRASESAKPGLQDRINVLDKRLVQLETDIASNGQLIQQAVTGSTNGVTSGRGNFSGPGNFNMTPIAVVFTIFVLCPMALAASRLMWRRASRPAPPAVNRESEMRMERVEQAVDAIAVEIERISEGQRFVTQLLSKTAEARSLGVGQAPAEPLKVSLNDTMMAGVQRKGAIG